MSLVLFGTVSQCCDWYLDFCLDHTNILFSSSPNPNNREIWYAGSEYGAIHLWKAKNNLHQCNVLILLEGKIWKGVSFSSVQVEQLTSATQEPRWIMIKAKVAMIMNTKKTRPSILGESQIFRLWLHRWPLKMERKTMSMSTMSMSTISLSLFLSSKKDSQYSILNPWTRCFWKI